MSLEQVKKIAQNKISPQYLAAKLINNAIEKIKYHKSYSI